MQLYAELEAAMAAEITTKVLDLLVEIAEIALDHDDSGLAVEILALALQYPMRPETLELAEDMFGVLQAAVYPGIIRDAAEQAQRMTLEEMVAHVLQQAAR